MKNSLMVLILGLIFCCSRVETPKNYLALGDSYTIGEGVAESDRWPVQLVEDLENRGYSIDSLQIIARTSWTTDKLVLGVLETPTLPEYDLITIMIGVNNQYRGRSLENFKEELEILIKLSLKMTGGDPSKVFLISIPDWGVTPYADRFDGDLIADEINAFNLEIIQASQESNIHYIDVTELSRQAAQDSTLLVADGLNPSGLMYTQWVEKMAPIIYEAVND